MSRKRSISEIVDDPMTELWAVLACLLLWLVAMLMTPIPVMKVVSDPDVKEVAK